MQLSKNTEFTPLLGAIKQIQFWLDSNNPPLIMFATPTIEEFLSQNLPTHCKVTKRKHRGQRVPVRGRRISRENAGAHAHWPEDDLVEGIRSMLTVVLRGNPTLRVSDYQVQCKAGDILFTPGYLPRWNKVLLPKERAASNEDIDFAVFFGGAPDMTHVSVRLSRYRSERLIGLQDAEACWLRDHLMGQVFSGLEEYLRKEHRNANAIQLLKTHLTLFVEKMETGRGLDVQAYPSDSPLMRHKDPVEHAQEYIRNHLDRDLSIDIVASWVGVSRSTFTRHFRTKLGQTFTEFLIEQRLERAKVLLCETDFPVVRVCERVGLKPWRLRELFRERFNTTPTKYRKAQNRLDTYAVDPIPVF